MGRSKKSHGQQHGSRGGKRMGNFFRVSTQNKGTISKKPHDKGSKRHQLQKNQRPVVPFLPSDRILLVGEGDFSFALSLSTHHGCKRMLATCYDSESTLYEKYPQAKQHINQLCASKFANSARGLKRKRGGTPTSEDGPGSNGEQTTQAANPAPNADKLSPKVLFSIDAKKLGLTGGGGKVIRKGFPCLYHRRTSTQQQRSFKPKTDKERDADESGPWDIICFNFPHVGGLSTDVNRQVRANQELLVSFFKACVPLLSAPPLSGAGNLSDEEDEEYEGFSGGSDSGEDPVECRKLRTEPGQIIVTLFEGEPYTLWNIRDLARHAGLRVVTSFKFPWASYPGYSHARTLGEVEGKDGERAGWKGEDREARSYVFERKGFEGLVRDTGKRKKKKGGSDDSESD
ncbi:conserved hypothetical protein [Uncinocarpus reesii 1704]|uniref:25S rRNA (uridine-N(3))-methyltransferase BMT5-like domain-containing protein n=1 Tax=Uncinocarpus reesii (strain UAMH 1704) TaxID=336963 RepID=C4JMG6_UNCRE|nr:uncharacterized protein UREG_04024 [Uncinocarpus reesii 1704]EEP79178.1 conserved hypothetical protein [Uncinocarpus reesii 1704]